MEIKLIIDHLSRLLARQPNCDWKLFVKVFNPGTVGGTPCVAVTQLNFGIDWDNGKVILETEVPLTKLSGEDVADIHKSAKDGQSWHAFQSYKKQAARIKELETELNQLRAAKK